MGGSVDGDRGRGLGGVLGFIVETVIGRMLLGLVMLITGTGIGTKLGREHPWTSLDDAERMRKHLEFHAREARQHDALERARNASFDEHVGKAEKHIDRIGRLEQCCARIEGSRGYYERQHWNDAPE